jgi:hypothetical protein
LFADESSRNLRNKTPPELRVQILALKRFVIRGEVGQISGFVWCRPSVFDWSRVFKSSEFLCISGFLWKNSSTRIFYVTNWQTSEIEIILDVKFLSFTNSRCTEKQKISHI